MQNSKLVKLEMTDVLLDRCNLANSVLHESIIYRTQWSACRLTGIDASNSSFMHTVFDKCIIDLGNFRFTSFKNVNFRSCMLNDAEFGGADLRGVRFSDCILKQTQFSGAKLKGTDLRGSDIDGLGIPPENLRGVIIDPSQLTVLAGSLIKHFGLIVQNDE